MQWVLYFIISQVNYQKTDWYNIGTTTYWLLKNPPPFVYIKVHPILFFASSYIYEEATLMLFKEAINIDQTVLFRETQLKPHIPEIYTT